ncbi:MAG: MFS transporter [Candidatus Bathyarchaeota archaeon]|nr:MFS transporter [Candidatus Bathyarchaeota archaeon]
MSSVTTRACVVLFTFATFAFSFGSTLLEPVLPIYGETFGVSMTGVALLFTIYSMTWAILQIFTGRLSDIFGRKPMIILGWILYGISSVLCPSALDFNQFLTLRILQGFGTALWGPASVALAVDLFRIKRGKGVCLYRSTQNLRGVVGPAIGGFLAGILYLAAPFYFSGILAFLAALLVLSGVSEPKFNRESKTRWKSYPERVSNLWGDLRPILVGNRTFLFLCIVGLTGEACFASLALVPSYAKELGASKLEIGFLFTAYSLAFITLQTPIGMLSDRMGRKPVLLLGALGSAIAFYTFTLTDFIYHLIAIMVVLGMTLGSVYTISTTAASDLIPSAKRGTLLGTFDAIIDFGFIIGPLYSGLAADKFGMGTPYILNVFILAVAALMVLVTIRETL